MSRHAGGRRLSSSFTRRKVSARTSPGSTQASGRLQNAGFLNDSRHAMAFARTKIQRPRRRPGTQIDRPALERRLGEALLTHRLVLLCAAAGFGKTSALARQAELLPQGTALAWIACDVEDSPLQFFECLIAALEPYDPPWRTAPEALMRAAAEAVRAEQRRAVAAEVINALDACEVPHGVIVIDDLHRIEHPAVLAFIDALLERLTPRWTLAIASRREPPLSLARLRVQGEVADFRLEDLRFERDEARELSARAGMSEEEADRLFQRAQGWPVGLRLALNAQRPAAGEGALANRSGSIDRHVFDFLADEVIDQLAPALREFLLCTSVLPELTAGRGAALSGDASSALRLEEIEREGLFVSVLDTPEPTLRLHDLFREALQARLARERPEQFHAVLGRAAATETDPIRRVGWLQRMGAWDAAEAVLADSVEELVAGGAAAAVRSAFERFPVQQRESSARLQMLIAQTRWDWDTAIDASARAARAFEAQGDEGGRLTALSYRCRALSGANRHPEARATARELLSEPLLGGDALARTLVAASWVEMPRGDQRALAPLWQRLNDTLQGSDSLARWTECAPLGPLIGLPGMRVQLQRYLDGARRRLPEHPAPLRGLCHVMQGWMHLWAGNIVQAETSAMASADDSRWLARPVNLDAPSRSLQAVLHAIRGRGAAAMEMLETLMAEIESSGVPMRIEVYLSLYQFLALRCAAVLGDSERLRPLAARLCRGGIADRSWLSGLQLASAAAHLAAAEGKLDEACRRWQEMLDDESRGDIYGQLIETRLRLADGLLQIGAPIARAAGALSPLFDRLQASGEWGAVLMAGPGVLRRLALTRWHGTLSPVQCATLNAWSDQAARFASGDPCSDNPAAHRETGVESSRTGLGTDPLTLREHEVLSRIAAGDSNKVIARALDLSPHTVKRHVANILDKLVLASRGQAAAWYRTQGRLGGETPDARRQQRT